MKDKTCSECTEFSKETGNLCQCPMTATINSSDQHESITVSPTDRACGYFYLKKDPK